MESYGFMKDIHGSKKNTKTTPVSAVLPPSDLLFLLREQLQGFMKVRSMKVSTNQWHNYGSVHLAIFDHLLVLIVIFNMREVAISPKYNFEKLMRN